LRYNKVPRLDRGNLFGRQREIGALGRTIMELTWWITGLYNSDIMNLMHISHFGCGKNVGLCMKQLLARVHGAILWMDRPVLIDVALIYKIIGFTTVGVQPEEYLENKAREKEIAKIVKAQFGTNRGNMGIFLKDINDLVTWFTSKLMHFKLQRKCRKEEAPTGVIVVIA
jgi:hypothetical protein